MHLDRIRTSKSILWSSVENGGLALVSFGTLVLFSRILSPKDFGVFAMALAIIEVVGILPGMFFHDALVQRRSITELHFDTAFTATLVIGVLCFMLCLALAPLFSSLTNEASAGYVLASLATTFIFSSISATAVARHRREFRFRVLAVRSLVARITGAVVGLTAALLGAGLWSLVLQHLVMSILGSALLWIKSENRPRFRIGRSELFELSRFGLPAMAALFASFAAKRCFVFLSGFFLGVEAAGYVNLAFRTVDTLWAVSASAVSQVILPMMSGVQADPDAMRRMYRKSINLCCTILYPVFAGLALVANDIVVLIFGANWQPSSPYVVALALLVLAQTPRLFSVSILTAIGKPHLNLYVSLAGLACLLAAIFLSGLKTPHIAIMVWVFCELVYVPVFFVVLSRYAGLSVLDQIRPTIVPAVATIAMAVAVTAVRYFVFPAAAPAVDLGIAAAVGAIAFVVTIRVLDRGMFMDIVSLLKDATRR